MKYEVGQLWLCSKQHYEWSDIVCLKVSENAYLFIRGTGKFELTDRQMPTRESYYGWELV